jgi:hypothetical protein
VQDNKDKTSSLANPSEQKFAVAEADQTAIESITKLPTPLVPTQKGKTPGKGEPSISV